ncbi:MAG: hypothetical protein L3J54_01230 [Draconibacterium sp.]|nr:hypothetical protein [Draconibacterium sp.]
MKLIYLLIITMVISVTSFAQIQDTSKITTEPIQEPVQEPVKKESKFDKSKMYFGGYANMSFGSYTVIGVQPLVGYKLTPKFSIGGKVSYEYIKDKRYLEDYTTSNYGASVFSRLRILPTFYGHVEFSSMSYDLYDAEGNNSRKWVPFLYVGGGYSQRLTKNSYLNAQILFDVINSDNSPYKSWEPYYSVGIGVGF